MEIYGFLLNFRCPQFRDQPPGSTATYNGKCYVFYNRNPLIFREALQFCRSRGGTLVDESNPALQGASLNPAGKRQFLTVFCRIYQLGAVEAAPQRLPGPVLDGRRQGPENW